MGGRHGPEAWSCVSGAAACPPSPAPYTGPRPFSRFGHLVG